MLCGIGFYSYLPQKSRGVQKAGGKSRQWLYEKYGKKILNKKNLDGHTFWQPKDIKRIIRIAKKNGWSGIATWHVLADVTKDIPNGYSLLHVISEELERINKN